MTDEVWPPEEWASYVTENPDIEGDPLACDSSADVLEETAQELTIRGEDGTPYTCRIMKNQFVDLNPACGVTDPLWGYSVQVADIVDGTILVRIFNIPHNRYEIQALSPEWVVNAYNHEPRNEVA